MVRQAFADTAARQRLLEGFLLRLARHRDADGFALRGGMLVRHWFPSSGRVANDVDLVCGLPRAAEPMRGRMREILADTEVDDGVVFEADRFRIDQLRPDSAHPGLRLFAVGRADGRFAELSVDLTFALEIWPTAGRTQLTTSRGEASLWVCPPEMLIARKLQVTAELGRGHWRPKDLGDMWWMLRRFSVSTARLGEAIERAFVGHPESQSVDAIAEPATWWRERHAEARWGRFSRRFRAGSLPHELGPVLAELRTELAPFLRSR